MVNYKAMGGFLLKNGRLPKDKKELAKFILFGGVRNEK